MRRKRIVLIKTKECIVTHGKHAFFVRNCCELLRGEQKKLWNAFIFLPAASKTNKNMFLLANVPANKDTTVKDTKQLSFLLLTLKLKSPLALSSLNIFVLTHVCLKKKSIIFSNFCSAYPRRNVRLLNKNFR